jgi:uncharacterized membrane protein HdeD (DUF308 family)
MGLIVLGALSIYAPQQSGMTVGVLVGMYLVASGLLRAALFWIAGSWGSAILRLLFGIFAIVAGGMMIADPALGLKAITIVAIVYLIVDGITAFLFGLALPPRTGGGWVLLSGAVSVALGIMIWREWPLAGDRALGTLIGIKLAMEGATLIAVGFAFKALGAVVSSVAGGPAQSPDSE